MFKRIATSKIGSREGVLYIVDVYRKYSHLTFVAALDFELYPLSIISLAPK